MDFGPLSMVLMIFGGCCSNVFALEAIIKTAPGSGLLITFSQFLFTTIAAYGTQFSPGSPYTVREPTVPVRRWLAIALMFFGINMLNNWAFAFNISIPAHIILRSFGSVTTMMAGYIRGRRYSTLQVFSVVLLTSGVLISAWADSKSKGKSMSVGADSSDAEFASGLAILLIAQLLSAYMGTFVEDTYAAYKASWTENLFYSHAFSLPFFLPLAATLRASYARLANTSPLSLHHLEAQPLLKDSIPFFALQALSATPQGLLFLAINTLTQIACISGVNLLSAKSSAVTVTIVLNIRKLVSFIFSTILFGHHLTPAMVLGSALVFGSGALYGWESSWRIPQRKQQQKDKDRVKDDSKRE